MASDIQKLYDLPDISFIDDVTSDTILDEMVSDFEEKYYELSGEYEILGELDKYRILINAVTLKLYQGYQYLDRAGKMNLLKYSSGDYLLNLGANRSVAINEEKAATCTVKFTLSQALSSAATIPAGTQITAGDGVYFETEEAAEIAAGETSVTTSAICQITGTAGNDYSIGQINIIVEPIAYVASVTNTTVPTSGEDLQTDDEYRETIFLAPSEYSTAGPEDAYIYWTKQFSSSISDVKVTSPLDDTVQVTVLKEDGEIPDEDFLTELKEHLGNSSIKPMTEQVTVTAPTVINYDITGTYYINKSDINNATNIQTLVSTYVDEYVTWQKEKIGRDLNPFYLQYLLAKAGVKRVDLTSPTYAEIDDDSIAIEGTINITYGGIESD